MKCAHLIREDDPAAEHGQSGGFPGDDHGTGGVGVKRLYLYGSDGHVIADRIPFQGTGADVFVQMQFPVHSGRILGLPGRIGMSVMGLIVAMLSITGLVIRFKRRGGLSPAWKQNPVPTQAARHPLPPGK